jgi:hypothetical protein
MLAKWNEGHCWIQDTRDVEKNTYHPTLLIC